MLCEAVIYCAIKIYAQSELLKSQKEEEKFAQ